MFPKCFIINVSVSFPKWIQNARILVNLIAGSSKMEVYKEERKYEEEKLIKLKNTNYTNHHHCTNVPCRYRGDVTI
jgi:hypothetical protein